MTSENGTLQSVPSPQEHTVVIVKGSDKLLNDKHSTKHIEAAVAGINAPSTSWWKRGWKIATVPSSPYMLTKQEYNYPTKLESTYTYTCRLLVTYAPDREYPDSAATFQNLLGAFAKKLSFPGHWVIDSVDGENYQEKLEVEQAERKQRREENLGYVPIQMPEDFETYFEGLYGLEANISRIKRALMGTMKTGWRKRLHCVCLGDPACGKSDLVHRLKLAFGEESVLEFDATATTMAGAITELDERNELPRILVVEEIEKADEKSLDWLLAFMDQRGEIRKRTARKNIQKDTKMICVATANDEERLKSIRSGALYSRFANRIYFTRPTRETLGRILEREVQAILDEGEEASISWIIPCLDLAEKLGTTDPREIINMMLCGQDGLLDGSYQKELIATMPPKQAKAVQEALFGTSEGGENLIAA